ncbi:MAG: glycosyltransferase [Planctomycetes bacterium]|nr:glycosyltransferase [Planctomycetota bacterium]
MIDDELRRRRDGLVSEAEGLLDACTSPEARQKAQALVVDAEALGPPSHDLLCVQGVLAWLEGARERARTAFERALVLDPGSEVARENLEALSRPKAKVATHEAPPRISIIVPAYGSRATIVQLVESLKAQTANPNEFEVVIVDDGSPQPLAPAIGDCNPPFRVRLIRQDNAGPATARNRAIAVARADELLILNADAIADPGLVAGHLEARETLGPEVAILGAFPFSAAARQSPFVRLLEANHALFAYDQIVPGNPSEWIFFWTCNLSVRRNHVLAVGGFDEGYREPICEDVDLGWRLYRDRGVQVVYRPDLICQHDHRLDPAAFRKRQRMFGRNQFRMASKYDNFGLLSLGWAGPWDGRLFDQVKVHADRFEDAAEEAFDRLQAFDVAVEFASTDAEPLPGGRELVQTLGLYEYLRGVYEASERKTFSPKPKDLRCQTARRLQPRSPQLMQPSA